MRGRLLSRIVCAIRRRPPPHLSLLRPVAALGGFRSGHLRRYPAPQSEFFHPSPRAEECDRLTSTAPLQDEDFFRKTAMSRREDILRCIDVTIMDRSTHTALPSSYSKTFPALRAGAAVTHATGLGGKGFIDFREPRACVSAFIRQHGSERTPPRIEHRLGLSGLRQSGSVHVANEHRTVTVSQPGAQFVQEIFPPVGHFGVNPSNTLSVACPLSARQRGFEIAVEALGVDRRHAA